MMAAVLLRASKGEWVSIGVQLEAMIQSQTMLPVDERSVGVMSFGLFWAGRAYLEQSRVAEATEMWRRLASEYYSTYYGALGHFMLEKTQGRQLALQPARTPGFRMQALRDAFSLQDQQKVRRIEALMRIGLKNAAICELEELDVADGKAEKVLVKALVMHAAGHWLDAIKTYDAIPRSFRNSLPVGFERILFPQRFGPEVRALALKAKVDPDLVLAIIRQESVFNPLARSPVGAMGLMQLMPQTARLEMKRIELAYMPAAEKGIINQHLNNPLGLLLAETNLKIGVHHVRSLLEKYLSPVYVLTAYNASPAATQRWITTLPTKDALAFIERIPYKETRAYVKLVLRNYFYYKRWYGNTQDALLHLDTVTSPLLTMLNQRAALPPLPAGAALAPPPGTPVVAGSAGK
jgi:soluble lytic murein transglycosylase